MCRIKLKPILLILNSNFWSLKLYSAWEGNYLKKCKNVFLIPIADGIEAPWLQGDYTAKRPHGFFFLLSYWILIGKRLNELEIFLVINKLVTTSSTYVI